MTGAGRDLLTAGVDVGSGAVKSVVLLHEEGGPRRLGASVQRIRRRDLRQVIDESFAEALAHGGVARDDLAYVASTGEGTLVDFRRGHFFGMTTHARGGLFLEPEARAVLDVGALHARAIRMDDRSRVLACRMTSQCASGSGQFLESIARYLGLTLEEIGPLSIEGRTPEAVSSICAVLAETDVINMVSRGIDVRDILKGIHVAMAGRCVRLLAAAGAAGVVAVTGGLSIDVGLIAGLRAEAERQKLAVDIRAAPDGILAGALGAALWAAFRHDRLAARCAS
jgi:benzoyl-CoA reductase subunit D